MPQKEYRVSWTIDVSDETIEDAVSVAVDLYLRPEKPDRWVYEVEDRETGERFEVEKGRVVRCYTT